MEAVKIDFPASSFLTGYVSKIRIHGDDMWALMDCQGQIVCVSSERAGPFFYASDHDITVVQRH